MTAGQRVEGWTGTGGRHPTAAAGPLVVLAFVLALPYILIGPNHLADDWWLLEGQRGGILDTVPDHFLRSRPGSWVVLTATFGLIGPHPVALQLVQTAVVAATAVAVFVAGRLYLPAGAAFAVAAMWLVMPNHMAAERWASVIQTSLSLCLCLVGVVLLHRAVSTGGRAWPAVAVLAAACLAYEAVLVAALVAAVVVPVVAARRAGRPLPTAQIAGGAGAILAVGGWMAWNTPKDLSGSLADPLEVLGAQIGGGLSEWDLVGQALALVAFAAIAVAAGRLVAPGILGSVGFAEKLIVAGLVLIGVGAVPFVRYEVSFYGLGDRANTVSAVGGAVLWVGVLIGLWRWRPPLMLVVVAVLLVGMASARAMRDASYVRAGRDGPAILAELDRRRSDYPDRYVVIGPEPPWRRGVSVFVADADVASALRMRWDPSAVGAITFDADGFAAVPPEHRFDLRSMPRFGFLRAAARTA